MSMALEDLPDDARLALDDMRTMWLLLIEAALAASSRAGEYSVLHAPHLPEGHAVLLASTSVLMELKQLQDSGRKAVAEGMTEAALAKAMGSAPLKVEGEG